MANVQFRDVVKKYAGTDEALGVPAGTVGGIPVVTPDDLGPAAAMTPAEVVTDEDAQAALSATFAPLAAGIEGTGMPGGVVTAPVGTVYRDLAATNGAVVWVKASGTGNTGWRVVWGDTGFRVLAAWDGDGNYTYGTLGSYFKPRLGATPGSVMVRRINDSVSIQANNVLAAQSSDGGIDRELVAGVGSLVGFRPIGGSSPAVAPLPAARFGTYRTYSDTLWWAHPANYQPDDLLISSTLALASFHTADNWPTTLPGTTT